MSNYTAGALRIFSGKCCLCDVGIPVNAFSTWGDPVEIHTGDIVIVWHGDYIGTDIESWTPTDGMTAVVASHYQSFSDDVIELRREACEPFAMGIKDCGFNHPEWRVQVVKKFSDVVPGEHWPVYGFSYDYSEAADVAIAKSITKSSE